MPRTVAIRDLQPTSRLESPILSVEGFRLLEPGDAFDHAALSLLLEHGFDPVICVDNDDDAERYIRDTRYQERKLHAIAPDDIAAIPVYDESERLLVQAGHPIQPSIISTLKSLGVRSIYVTKPQTSNAEERTARFLASLAQARKNPTAGAVLKKTPKLAIATARMCDPSTLDADELERSIEEGQDLNEKPQGAPLAASINTVDPAALRSTAHLRAVIHVHESVIRSAEQIFAQIRLGRALDGEMLGNLASHVISGLIHDRNVSLNLAGLDNSPHYLVSHSINTTLLAVHIAAELGYSAGQVYELAYGAFLHDIGMMRIPPELNFKKGTFTEEERLTVEKHPVIGLDLLHCISRVPKSAPIVVYQENERLDGSGYPRRRSRQLIHSYAKIVAVAATYEAMTSERPWRPAMLPYRAMEMLLQQVNRGKLESVAARALLKVLSLFPVGSWVRMSDQRIARVIAANGEQNTRPVVSVILEASGAQRATPLPLDLCDPQNATLSIAEPMQAPASIKGNLRMIGF